MTEPKSHRSSEAGACRYLQERSCGAVLATADVNAALRVDDCDDAGNVHESLLAIWVPQISEWAGWRPTSSFRLQRDASALLHRKKLL